MITIGKVFKTILKLIGKKTIIITLIVVSIFVFLAGSVYFIFLDLGIWDKDETGNPKSYTGYAKIDPEQGITSEKDVIINEALSSLGYSDEKIASMTDKEIIKIFDMSKKLKRNVTSLEECTHAELLWCFSDEYSKFIDTPEDLEYLLQAELVTQYPKIDSLSSNSEALNGIIEFWRITKNEGEEETRVRLTYISPEEFDKKFNNYIEKGNKEVFNYFTLDEELNVVIATWSQEDGLFESNNTAKQNWKKIKPGYDETRIKEKDERYAVTENTSEVIKAEYTTYSATKKTIYYKQVVQKYTLPFQYLWSLLVMGESYDFVKGLAELAYTSEITVGIYDNITTTVNVNAEEYVEDFKERIIKYEKTSSSSDYSEVSDETTENSYYNPAPYYEKETITYKDNLVTVDLIRANVWFVDILTTYEYVEEKQPQIKNEEGPYTEEWKEVHGTTYGREEREKEVGSDYNGMDQQTYTVYTKTETYSSKRTSEHKYISTIDTSSNRYERAGEPVISEKTDIDESTDNNFVKLLINDSKAYRLLTNKTMQSWLSEILSSNEDTANMSDLTLYLLAKTKDPDQTRIDHDFSMYEWKGNFVSQDQGLTADGDFDVSDKNLFITDVETLKKAFTGYSRSDKLIQNAEAFLKMQEKYQVNALFAAAVSITETGAGNAGNAVKIANSSNSHGVLEGTCWNNWFNVKTTGKSKYGIVHNGEGESHYRIYDSVEDSIMGFGSNIAEGKYYYRSGNYTVNKIGHVYCPNSSAYPTQGDDWVANVLNYIGNFYSAAGIKPNTGSMVQYYQTDYAHVSYGTSNLAKSGCGPTSFAMIATALGKPITPVDAINWCGNTYYVKGAGTSWAYFEAATSHFGLDATVRTTTNISEVVTALRMGKYVISSQGKGIFTSAGHFIVLSGIDENDKISVKDPNKRNAITKGYNNRRFSPSEIHAAAKQYFIFY